MFDDELYKFAEVEQLRDNVEAAFVELIKTIEETNGSFAETIVDVCKAIDTKMKQYQDGMKVILDDIDSRLTTLENKSFEVKDVQN